MLFYYLVYPLEPFSSLRRVRFNSTVELMNEVWCPTSCSKNSLRLDPNTSFELFPIGQKRWWDLQSGKFRMILTTEQSFFSVWMTCVLHCLFVCFLVFQMFKVKISPKTIHIPFYLVYNTNFKTSEYFFCH